MSPAPLKKPRRPVQAAPAGIKKASLIQRIITGAVFVIVVLGAIWAGNTFMVLPLLMAVFGVLGTREFYRIVSPDMPKLPTAIGMFYAAAIPLIIFAVERWHPETNLLLGAGEQRAIVGFFYLTIIVLAALMIWVAVNPASKLRDACASFMGAVYLGVPLACLMLIRDMGAGNEGLLLAIAMLFSIWATDSFAYLGGSLFGKHKLAPQISPKKSWEGLVAGAIGGIVFWYVVPLVFVGSASWRAAVILGIVVTLTALLGDLFESRIKREAGVKDSGTLLPGHGGLLDRIDSLLLTAPILFIVFSVLGASLGLL